MTEETQDRIDLLSGRIPRKRQAFVALCDEATFVLRQLTADTAGTLPLTQEHRDSYADMLATMPGQIRDAFLALEADRAELHALENPEA